MPTIAWNENLSLGHFGLDATHREFIDRLGALEEACANAPELVSEILDELLRHTRAHFAEEERWMADLGFGPGHCHLSEHRMVLELMQEVQRRQQAAPDTGLVGQLVAAVDQWFALHAPKHDAGLLEVMRQAGYDDAASATPALT